MHDRTFLIKCVKGFPKYNAKIINKKTKTPEVLRLVHELDVLKKRLFAYRLVHYGDVVPEIEGLNISGRALELTESALLLFHKYRRSEEEAKIFNEAILPTLSSFLGDRLGRRNDSLEGRLYPVIATIMKAQESDEFDNDTIFNTVMTEMGGREIPGKSDMFFLDDIGMVVTRTKIMKVLREKFKAIPVRPIAVDGKSRPRCHRFSKEVLERIKASYEDVSEIKIISSKNSSVQADRPDQVLDQYGEQNDKSKQQDQAEKPDTHEGDQSGNMANQTKNEEKEPFDVMKNSDRISTEPGLPGLVGQTLTIEETILYKAMRDGDRGTNKGYCRRDDFIFPSVMEPNLHWTEDKAEEAFNEMIRDGRLEEFEPDRYRPTQKLSVRGGD